MPVDTVMYRKSWMPRAAPNACSPSAATLVSRSRTAGRSRASATAPASSTLRNPGPTFGGSMITPRTVSTGPGAAIPIATGRAWTAATSCATSRSWPMHAATTASGPADPGVAAWDRATTTPPGVTTPARIRLAPRSSASTGPSGRLTGTADMGRPPRSLTAGAVLSGAGVASAADLENLAAALRAGPLEGRLAVLHRDALGVLNLDLFLVLDAIGFGHRG